MTWRTSRSKCATAARELAPTQPAASGKLRSALDGMDENDLGTRMQRSSDWLRSGKFSDPAETGLTSDLQKLGQQVGDAARALGSAQHASKDAALNRAMDDLSRLRDQLAGLGGRPNSQPRSQAGQGQPGRGRTTRRPTVPTRPTRSQRTTRSERPTRSTAGQAGQRPGPGKAVKAVKAVRQVVKPAASQAGQVGNRVAGPVGNARRWRGQSRRQRLWRLGHRQYSHLRVRPWRRNKVPTRPIRSARSTRA